MEDIKEMDELDLQAAMSDLVLLQREEFARNLKAMALASKAGFGSKEADREITKIARETNRDAEDEHRKEKMKVDGIQGANTLNLPLDLKKLGEVKLNGRNNRKGDTGASR